MTGDHIAVVGLGLVGGSLAAALTRAGERVVGVDADDERGTRARSAGLIAEYTASVPEASAGARCVFVAVPVAAVADVVAEALEAGAGAVSDVGSVKSSIVAGVRERAPDMASRFVGGHPMAGSEQEGLDGADPDLFQGATWVLTPTESTDPEVFGTVRSIVAGLGADVLAVDPDRHDALAAVVSHVPHLAASTLMLVAARQAHDQAALLRLAAGGFRDMTRIAAGHPGIWPDICVENRDAIVGVFDEFLAALRETRELVAGGDRGGLLASLESARHARTNLPITGLEEGPFVEVRVPVPDRPGVLAEVTTLAGQLGVNIVDLEIAHSMEGREGVLVLVVPEKDVEGFEKGLEELGYHSSLRELD